MSEKQVKIPSASERTNIFSPQTVTNRSDSSFNASAETNVFSLGTAINNNTSLYGSGSNAPSGTNVFSLGAATNANAVLLPCSASLISLHDLNTGTDTLYCALPLDSYIFLEKIAQLRQHFNNLNKEQKDELLLQLQNRRLFQQQLTNYLQQQTLLLQKYNQRQGQRPRNNYVSVVFRICQNFFNKTHLYAFLR